LYQAAKKALQAYVKNSRDSVLHDADEQALFLNCNGSRITRQGFWKLLKNYQESAGIQKEITPQVLRNSFAVHLLENGADLKSIQEMLGHNDISSTQVYVNVLKHKIRSVYFSVHPRANDDGTKG
jgi:integrase/recombinase XerD